ncbi:MAG: hypothetical protein GF313_08145 [Caldithrix sp.]|nr:hypothetical protein [Caldithrix sp.]
MNSRSKYFLVVSLLMLLMIPLSTTVMARAIDNDAGNISVMKPQADKITQTLCNIGNWGFWANYNGQTGHDPFTGSSGGYYPRGTAAAIYMDGAIWGGYLQEGGENIADQPLRVGGIGYRIGTVPGWIEGEGDNAQGVAENERVRLYRVRSDYKTLTPAQIKQDVSENFNVSLSGVTDAMAQEIIASYEKDWNEWPVDLGAPWVDNNGDGVYDPEEDEAGIANADQVLWWVVNDLNEAKVEEHSGALPIGLEVRITLWAYNQPGAGLGQIVFKKYEFINKSGKTIDDMYFAQFSDPDLGSYSNDLVGVDTTESLHFAWNGDPTDPDYEAYGMAVPAAGYDFFQGPIVETGDMADTAVFDLGYRLGYKNLPMTTSGLFAAGGEIEDPDMGVYDFTLEWYNMMRGFIPTNDLENPTPWIAGSGPSQGQPTKFPVSGDPVTGEGDIDGQGDNMGPGDRRMYAATGPFTMAPMDTQEVVVALVAEQGTDNISSISAMRNVDVLAQTLYNDLFRSVPKPPAQPKLAASNLDEYIVLNWSFDKEAVATTEADNPLTGYDFEGYNLYQVPSPNAALSDGVRIGTFDKVNGVQVVMGKRFIPEYGQVVEIPVQYGADAGVQRFFHVEKNHLTGQPLFKGTTYHYAVSAYNYNENPQLIEDKALESAAARISVTHQGPKPGDRYEAEAKSTIEITHDGPSDGQVEVVVVDPSAVTGHEYSVFFEEDTDTNSATYGQILWGLEDNTTGEVVLEDQQQISSLDSDDQIIVDGLQVKVSGPSLGTNKVAEYDQDGNELDGSVSILAPSLGTTGYLLSNRAGAVNQPPFARDWDRFGYWGMDDLEIDFADSSLTWDYISETLHYDSTAMEFDYAPYAMYRHIFTTGERVRLFAGFWDTDGNGQWSPPNGDWTGPIYGAGSYEPIYAWQGYDADGNVISYDPANEAQYIADNSLLTSANTTWGSSTGDIVYPYVTAMLMTMYADGATPPWGNKIIFTRNKPNTVNDVFSFAAPTTESSQALAKQDVEKVNVFPNPYYAGHSNEENRFDRYVTFNHLPQQATFRIFNLAGVQVRKLEKDDDSQFFRWDLQNESGLPVASGMYIVHIDMPDLGEEKVLKVMIVQPQQVLEYY